jgi:hypothetical protein
MKPDGRSTKVVGGKASARALVDPGRAYAVYIRGKGSITLKLAITAGVCEVEWVDTKTGIVREARRVEVRGSDTSLKSPPFKEDIALLARRAR